jgi:hypothetical protein
MKAEAQAVRVTVGERRQRRLAHRAAEPLQREIMTGVGVVKLNNRREKSGRR